jgi:hypothetical protein
MADVRTGEFSGFSNNLLVEHRLMKYWLWDCGPEKPQYPDRPVAPNGKEGDPKFDLAKIEFKEYLDAYEAALKKYRDDRRDFEEWQKTMGGPVERLMWSVDALSALTYDAEAVAEKRQGKRRWFISGRNKGYESRPNYGLPEGMKPGHGHAANLEREAAGLADFERAKRADPVFGQELGL